MALKVKPEYAGVIIGFKNSSLPLGQRSEADLNFLYQRAQERNIQEWIIMFEPDNIPNEKEIDAVKEKTFNEKISAKSPQRKNSDTIG